MSTRAAIQPRPKKSGSPSSHQYSNSTILERRRSRRLLRRDPLPEQADFAPLAQQRADQREHAEEGAHREEGEEKHHERRLQREVEIEAQRDRLDVLGGERDQQHENDE